MLRWFLFETWPGDLLLAWLERWAGLAVVPLEQLEGTAAIEADLVPMGALVREGAGHGT